MIPRRKRRDTWHTAAVRILESHGCRVFDLSAVGGGCPDLMVAYHGGIYLVEVKAEKGKLTPAQIEFHARWPVEIVRDLNGIRDVIARWHIERNWVSGGWQRWRQQQQQNQQNERNL